MKKVTMIISVLLLCLLCNGCQTKYSYWDMQIEQVGEAIKLFENKSLDDLEGRAAAIVRGSVRDDAEQVNLLSDESPLYATKMSLEIVDVYKGDLQKGDVVTLIENWYLQEEDGEAVLFLRDEYMPSDPNREYIFILGIYPENANFPGAYGPIDSSVARFPSPLQDHPDNLFSISEREAYMCHISETYQSIYAKILEKYF